MSKLYTEEQVRKAIQLAQKCESDCGGVYFYYTETDVIDELTPIELPTDDEIDKANGYAYYGKPNGEKYLAFNEGAIWMRDKIKRR